MYFNPAAFAVPAIGSVGVNIMYGPSYMNHDVTVARKIAVGEKREFQLKVEAFNVLNHVQFTGVNSGFTFTPCTAGSTGCIAASAGNFRNTNANIGALTGERGPRILSLELRFQF